MATTEERVIEIVAVELNLDQEQTSRTSRFVDDMGADSLDIVELLMELEEEFDITIHDHQAEKIKTVGEAIDHVEREIAKR